MNASRFGLPVLFAAIALPPIAYRGLAMQERGVGWTGLDNLGLGSDLLVACGLCLAMSAISKLRVAAWASAALLGWGGSACEFRALALTRQLNELVLRRPVDGRYFFARLSDANRV